MRKRPLGRRYAVALLSAAFVIGQASMSICDTISAAERDFNNAITALTGQSANWQTELDKLQSELAKDATNLVTQISYLSQQAANSVGTQTRCDIVMLNSGVKRTLDEYRLIDFHPGQKPAPAQPFPCLSAPMWLTLSDIRSGIPGADVLDIAGFDFNPSWLDPRLPNPTISVMVESGPSAGPLTTQTVPVSDYVVQDLNIFVSFNEVMGYRLPDDAKKVDIVFNNDPSMAFSVLVVAGPPARPQVTVNQVNAYFDSKDDGKNGDSLLSVSIRGGLVTYRQAPGTWMVFNAWSTTVVALFESGPIPFTSFPGAPVAICIAPNGRDTWNFDVTIKGSLSDGTYFSAFLPGNQVTQDVRCTNQLALPQDLPTFRPPPPPPGDGHDCAVVNPQVVQLIRGQRC